MRKRGKKRRSKETHEKEQCAIFPPQLTEQQGTKGDSGLLRRYVCSTHKTPRKAEKQTNKCTMK
jgi:hypothetical protein